MARKMTEWPSKRGPITKIMPSDGCIGDTVPLAVGKWYDFHEFGWYMGNVRRGVSGWREQFPWRWESGTISTNLDGIWGMSVKPIALWFHSQYDNDREVKLLKGRSG